MKVRRNHTKRNDLPFPSYVGKTKVCTRRWASEALLPLLSLKSQFIDTYKLTIVYQDVQFG